MKKAFWDKIYEDLGKKTINIELLLIELKDNIKGHVLMKPLEIRSIVNLILFL